MAQRTIVQFEDDLGGGPADETVSFGLDGRRLEIDLTADNAARLRAALSEFIPHARKVGRARVPRPRQPLLENRRGKPGDISRLVRAWGEQNGYHVAARGRISKDLVDAYRAAVG